MELAEEVENQPKISPKRIKFLEIEEKEEIDRISALPDCLILEILSRLPCTKDAIRTGTLSTRWKHIWTMVPSLIFIHSDYNLPWSDFFSLVDKTLTQCRQLKLKKFAMYTRCIGFESQFSNCIRYAIRCNVEELILRLCHARIQLDQSFFINTFFTRLILAGCMFNPSGAISWKNLKILSISCGKLNEDLFENILSGSPVLETLLLSDCYGYRRLNITSKSVKHLVLCGYMVPFDEVKADIIEINAPNILSLTILGNFYLWKLLLVSVSSLVKAELDYTTMGHYVTTRKEAKEDMLKGFILNLRHVKELKIGIYCSEVMSRLEAKGFVIPSNITFPEDAFYKRLVYGIQSDSDSDSVEAEDQEVLLLDDGLSDNEGN